MRVRKMLGMAVAATLLLGTVACGDDDKGGTVTPGASKTFAAGSTMEKLQKQGTVKVGTKFDQPLFGLKGVSGKVEGFDVEIAKIIAAELGIAEDKIQFVESVSKNREDFIINGTVDFIVATYTINDTRKEKVGFAGPYYTAGQDIMVKKGDTSITGKDSLKGKRVCSATGSTPAKRIQEEIPEAKLTLFATYTECAEALRNGQTDAVSTDNVILLGLIEKAPDDFQLVNAPFSTEPYGIGVKKDDTDFRNFINDVLEAAYKDGRYKAAYDKTLGKVQETMPAPPAVNRY
ncbi:MAG TPA: glutamate ABC transporter substrate-binding protein [Frankiaceae bacterium]|jgi:glutamate transport system substrate-binding protein|nr:glutamate ABC transporter substrate-binding protein [Frankiaceae bacterium]